MTDLRDFTERWPLGHSDPEVIYTLMADGREYVLRKSDLPALLDENDRLREALHRLEDVLTDPPRFDGVWSKNDKRWYMEGWHRLRRDARAALESSGGSGDA